MVQMRRELAIPMPPGSYVKVSLDFIALQTAVNPTRILHITPAQPRTLGELLPRIRPDMVQYMASVSVLLLLREPVCMFVAEGLVLVRSVGRLVIPLLHPQYPARVLLLQQVSGENVVTGCVLDVDAQGVAGHVDYDVEVEL